MEKINGNELTPSLTIRAYFAGQAMQGILANSQILTASADKITEDSVMMADMLIAELNKEKP